MPIEVRLPELAESMSSATLTTWLKEVGDHVTRGEPIAEVETDKTTVELEAPATGVIAAIQVSAGTADVAVGAVLALLRERSAADAPAPTAGRAKSQAPFPSPGPAIAPPPPEVAPETPPDGAVPPPAVGAEAYAMPAASAGPPPAAGVTAAPEAPATPLARRMAELAGLDLAAVRGSGVDGRIGKADVQRAWGAASGAAAARPPPDRPSPGGAPPHPALPAAPHHDEPLTAARRVTAARMAQSKQTAPHTSIWRSTAGSIASWNGCGRRGRRAPGPWRRTPA